MCKDCGCAAAGGNSRIQFFVKGYGEESAAAVEQTLLGLPGVYHVHIHAHDGETTIDYNPLKTRLSEIQSVFSERGLDAII